MIDHNLAVTTYADGYVYVACYADRRDAILYVLRPLIPVGATACYFSAMTGDTYRRPAQEYDVTTARLAVLAS